MNIQAEVLNLLAVYGLPALFGVILISAIGVPLPGSFMLIVVGSFVAQDEMSFWPTIAAAAIGAVIGDHVGYGLGRWGGRTLVLRLSQRMGSAVRLQQAEAAVMKWGGLGVFFTRWLITPAGPWVNLTTGMIGYTAFLFFIYDVAGETLWVILYITLGRVFYDQLDALSGMLNDLMWVILSALAATLIGWQLFRNSRKAKTNQ
jgi:membrane protein DedA with SNARE-associated domain